MTPLFSLHRRRVLAALGALGGGALPALFAPEAHADDYKALVCVFLFGGNDGLNTVVPLDARYTPYAAVRGRLALPKSSLIRLGGTDFGLHPSLASLASLSGASGRLAALFNTGPLVAPLTRADYLAAKGRGPGVPGSLFSHSDQQTLWEAGSADLQARTGWGGRAAGQMQMRNPVISVGGNGRFGLSDSAVPLVLPSPGEYFGAHAMADTSGALAKRKLALQALYAGNAGNGETPLMSAFAAQQRDAFEVSDRLRDLVWLSPGQQALTAPLDTAFAPLIRDGKFTNPLASQLYQVAKLVLGRAVVGGSRQIFFAQQGGYDTHNAQIADDVLQGQHAGLLKGLGDALAAFDAAMQAIGMGNAVTLFTQSDFGRTFAPNASDGTDHAWGNTQLVLGGAVKGGAHGRFPELALGGPDDVGVESWERHGRWLPSASVDQYAATLLRWLGASEAQLDATLPNLRNFGSARSLGFMQA
ncbi:DUF1501 domain-containing protein [Roseateles paludis]|uniref:DUF1501 domain-containing protein n=1 Tax=Roseateles paludis TaxID=3145238 RepID=A0ABV0G0L1_9BURK